jgi:hypothetical protein
MLFSDFWDEIDRRVQDELMRFVDLDVRRTWLDDRVDTEAPSEEEQAVLYILLRSVMEFSVRMVVDGGGVRVVHMVRWYGHRNVVEYAGPLPADGHALQCEDLWARQQGLRAMTFADALHEVLKVAGMFVTVYAFCMENECALDWAQHQGIGQVVVSRAGVLGRKLRFFFTAAEQASGLLVRIAFFETFIVAVTVEPLAFSSPLDMADGEALRDFLAEQLQIDCGSLWCSMSSSSSSPGGWGWPSLCLGLWGAIPWPTASRDLYTLGLRHVGISL